MRNVILITLSMMLLLSFSYALADSGIVIYSEDFSSDPGWITNNPAHFYWDQAGERYYYNIIDATQEYTYYLLPQLDTLLKNYRGSFELTYDVLPINTAWCGNFRCGVSDSNMSGYQPTSIHAAFFVTDGAGHGITLVVNDNIGRFYGVETPHSFTDGIKYQVTLSWNNLTWDLSMNVIEKCSGDSVLAIDYTGYGPFLGMDRIFMSSIGDFGCPGWNAEGYIDNVAVTFNPLKGDANCDKKISVGDVVYLINYLFKGGPPPCQ